MKPILALFFTAALWAGDRPMLTCDAFARARTFLKQTARPLEVALFAFHFEKGSAAAVIDELAKFQNADGGFASRLEPDIRWDGSSPMTTGTALGILKEVGAPATDPHVGPAVKYLMATYHGYWPALPEGVNSAAHAPWWHFDPKAGKCSVESRAYPTAGILANLRAYAGLVPEGFLDSAARSVLEYRELQRPDIGMLASLAAGLHDADLTERLRKALGAILVRDPKQWDKYNAQPLMFVHGPDALLYPGLEKETDIHLDYVISRQAADGGWDLNWSWPGPAWEAAKKEWRGMRTLEYLQVLRAFHRVE